MSIKDKFVRGIYSLMIGHRIAGTEPKKKELKQVYNEIYDASDSCQAIARAVHASSYERWTLDKEAEFSNAFKAACGKVSWASTSTKRKRNIVIALALSTGRSPAVVRARIAKLTRVNKAAAVKSILTTSKAKSQVVKAPIAKPIIKKDNDSDDDKDDDTPTTFKA